MEQRKKQFFGVPARARLLSALVGLRGSIGILDPRMFGVVEDLLRGALSRIKFLHP